MNESAPFTLDYTREQAEDGHTHIKIEVGGKYGDRIVYYTIMGVSVIAFGIIWLFLTAIFNVAGRIMAGG